MCAQILMHAFMVTIREWNLRQRTAGQMLYQLSYIPALSVYKKFFKKLLGGWSQPLLLECDWPVTSPCPNSPWPVVSAFQWKDTTSRRGRMGFSHLVQQPRVQTQAPRVQRLSGQHPCWIGTLACVGRGLLISSDDESGVCGAACFDFVFPILFHSHHTPVEKQ